MAQYRFQLVFTYFLLVVSSTAFAQRDLKDIPIPDPELERQTFVLPEGFDVNLFAADPQIAKPIQMNFDPQGRLWVVSSETYPQIEPGAKANDKVLILHDKDGDGVSDQTQVFADGLLIPTGIAPGDGGAYVGASTELLHLKDTDGDGKADQRNVVLSGFGTEDTHHIVHTFRWGPEQLLYFSQSIYIHSHLETPWGVKRLNAGGIWQFRPETMKLDVFSKGLVNSWGTAFNKYGQTFATDGAGGEGINYMVPGAYYVTAYGSPRILHGLNPGSPKHCGLEIVESEHLPEDWQGSYLTNDFRGHRVCRFVLTEEGAGYRSQEQQEVIKSNHVAFRPIDVKVGPDGAIYIADWYNPIIQHGEVDFRDERRDHTHGRIWRITCKDRALVKTPNLVDASTKELLSNLASPNKFTRQQSKRVLKERGDTIAEDLRAWTKAIKIEDSTTLLEAMWMQQAVEQYDMDFVTQLLQHTDHHVRAAATRLLGHLDLDDKQLLSHLTARVNDEHPQVRLEAIRVLSQSKAPEAVAIALQALDHPLDEWIDYVLWLSVRESRSKWEPLLADGTIELSSNLDKLTFLIQASGSTVALPSLIQSLENSDLPQAKATSILNVIAEFGKASHLEQLLQFALQETLPKELRAQALGTLLSASRTRKIRPGNAEAAISLIEDPFPQTQVKAIECLGVWKVKAARVRIEEIANNRQQYAVLRQAAVSALASYADEAAKQRLVKIASGDPLVSVRGVAIQRLIQLLPQQATGIAVNLMGQMEDATQAQPLLQTILARKGGAKLLEQTIAGKKLPKDIAVLALRMVASSGQANATLEKAIREAGNLAPEAVKLTPEQLQALVSEVKAKGDPHRGETVFRRQDLNCQKCHAVGTAGGQVGSNLVSLGATAQLDYIIESILDPNAKVKEGFHTLVVATDEGKVFSGIKVRETATELFLRDAEGKEVSVPIDSIEQQKQGVSLMPAGIMTNLTQQELLDLSTFLSSLGKEAEFTISTDPILRHWDVMQATKEAAYHLRRTSYASAATDSPAFSWQRSYARVNGDVSVAELPQVTVKNRSAPGTRGVSFVRTAFTTVKQGTVKLQLNDASGLQIWFDQQPLDANELLELDVQLGTHQLTIAVDQSVRTTPLEAKVLKDSINVTLPVGK